MLFIFLLGFCLLKVSSSAPLESLILPNTTLPILSLGNTNATDLLHEWPPLPWLYPLDPGTLKNCIVFIKSTGANMNPPRTYMYALIRFQQLVCDGGGTKGAMDMFEHYHVGDMEVALTPTISVKGKPYPDINRMFFCNVLLKVEYIFRTWGLASFDSKVVRSDLRVADFKLKFPL